MSSSFFIIIVNVYPRLAVSGLKCLWAEGMWNTLIKFIFNGYLTIELLSEHQGLAESNWPGITHNLGKSIEQSLHTVPVAMRTYSVSHSWISVRLECFRQQKAFRQNNSSTSTQHLWSEPWVNRRNVTLLIKAHRSLPTTFTSTFTSTYTST